MIRKGSMMIKPSPNINYYQYSPFYVQRTVSVGKRLVIVGQSTLGEYYHPTLIHSQDMAKDIFGSGALLKCYEDAMTFDENLQVYLMRVEELGLSTAFSVLKHFSFDLLFIDEMHFNKDITLFEHFIELAINKEESGSLIHGITSLSDDLIDDDLPLLKDRIQSLTKEMYGDEIEETGKYLSLVVSQSSSKNAGAVYAGLLASLDPEVSPVNKTIDMELDVRFTNEEILSLRQMGIVCFKETLKKGVVCTSSTCAVSTSGSVHKYISNFRIAQYFINELASRLQVFVGRSNLHFQSIGAEEIINHVGYEYINMGRIKDYDYSLSIRELYGAIDVDIEFVPIFSVQKIKAHTQVRIFK